MRILVVDDVEAQYQYLEIALAHYGSVEIARDGQEAIDRFEQAHRDKNPYRVIFMDVKMPIINGYDATKYIREYEKEHLGGQPAAIIMATALAYDEDVLNSFKSGADLHLPKPFSLSQVEGFMFECGFESDLS